MVTITLPKDKTHIIFDETFVEKYCTSSNESYLAYIYDCFIDGVIEELDDFEYLEIPAAGDCLDDFVPIKIVQLTQ